MDCQSGGLGLIHAEVGGRRLIKIVQ